MKFGIIASFLALAFAAGAQAQTPSIRSGPDGVVNNASYAPAGLPNSSIAQGSIFAIFGDNLGPAALAQQPSYPLQKTLAGTSVKVTVGGTTVDAIPIYTVKTQVGAVLPSNTPAGAGQVTVTYNGSTSAPHAITVTTNSFGTFSLNQQGSGPGVITDANYSVITLNNSAKPGQAIIIWGTGLGAISGDDAASPQPRDLTSIPAQVTIGGKPARLVYRGRSGCCSGLDQIVVEVPSGAEGCYQSLSITIGNTPSNLTTIPVAANGGVCSDPIGFSSGDLTNLIGKGSASFGVLSLGRSTSQTPDITIGGTTIPGSTSTSDYASGIFAKYDVNQLIRSQGLFQQASFGSCIVNTYSGSVSRVDPVLPTPLDAGTITLTPPSAAPITLVRDPQLGFYTVPIQGTQLPRFIPEAGGLFRFSGAGGANVGAFTADLTLGAPLRWTNMDAITAVTRGNGVTVTWEGGNADTYVLITGSSTLISGSGSSATSSVVSFTCTAPVAQRSFTVPRDVLLLLPASSTAPGGFNLPTGSLSVGNYTNPKGFTANGLDFGYVSGYVTSGKSLNYQ